RGGSNVYDGPAAAFDNTDATKGLGAQEGALEVYVLHGIPGSLGHVQQPVVWIDSGIVHERLRRPEIGCNRLAHRRDRVRAADIKRVRACGAAAAVARPRNAGG